MQLKNREFTDANHRQLCQPTCIICTTVSRVDQQLLADQ